MEHQSAIDRLLARARAGLERVEPGDLADEVGAGAVMIDIRYADPIAASRQFWNWPTSSTTTAYGCKAIIFASSEVFRPVNRYTLMLAWR